MASLIKPSHRGLLHDKMGIPRGQKIPAAALARAKKTADPAEKKEIQFAQNFGHKRGKR